MPGDARFSTVFAFLVFLFFIPGVSVARDAAYISPAQLPPQLLVPPPQEGSDSWRAEMNGVLAAQKHMPPTDIALMRDEQHMRLSLMTDEVGAGFTRERLPKTFALLDRVLADAAAVTEADKIFWHTRRPYLADKHVKLMVDAIDKSPAYPSGHTSETRVIAEVLGMLYPERLETFRDRAAAVAWHRVEAGVHYPNDLEGGRMLAMLIVGALVENADFQSDLADARDEIAAAK